MKDLNKIIYRYFPKGIDPSNLNYSYTTEIQAQIALIESELNKSTYFDEMSAYLLKNLNSEYKTDLSLKGIFDLSRKTLFKMPDNHHHQEYPFCVVSVSIIAPYFDIYFTKHRSIPINTITAGSTTAVQDFLKKHIANIVSTYFNGYSLIPYELSDSHVTEILSSKNFDRNATYYECLMTDTLW